MTRSIAVVTVCLNDLPGLQETYASLVEQDSGASQWIVIDGASVDGTPRWLGSLKWSALQWSSSPDDGIYAAMNKGLQQVKADYVLFLNSGDSLCDRGVLKSVQNVLASATSPPSLLFGDCYVEEQNGATFFRRARPAAWVPIGMPTSHQAMFFRKDAIEGGFETRFDLSSDYAAVCRLFTKQGGGDFHYLAQPLCRFRLGGRSETGRPHALLEDRRIRCEILGMGALPATLLHWAHAAHHVIKQRLPALHRRARFG